MRIFNHSVKSVLLYSSETWRITKHTVNKIQTFVNRCLWRIRNVKWSDKVSNNTLWTKTNQLPVEIKIKQRKWRSIGDMLRKPISSITRQALTWNPQGKTKRGRPRNTWRRDMESEIKRMGVHLAGNCHYGTTQDPVESFHRWPMLPASRRA